MKGEALTDKLKRDADGKVVVSPEDGRAADGWATETASVSWISSKGLHVRVYSVQSGGVFERCFDQESGKGWYTSDFSAPADHVSATHCQDHDGGVFINLYTTIAGETTEWFFNDGQWEKGAYTQA